MNLIPHSGKETSPNAQTCAHSSDTAPSPRHRPGKQAVIGIALLLLIVFIACFSFQYIRSVRSDAYRETVREIMETGKNLDDALKQGTDIFLTAWSDAIGNASESPADPDGQPKDALGDVLLTLYSDPDFMEHMAAVLNQKSLLQQLKQEIQNPPGDRKEYNDLLLRLIDNYTETAELLVHPYGSYDQVKETFSRFADERHQLFQELEYLRQQNS